MTGQTVRNTPENESHHRAMGPIAVSNARLSRGSLTLGPYNIDERSIQLPMESRLFDA